MSLNVLREFNVILSAAGDLKAEANLSLDATLEIPRALRPSE